MNNQDRAKQFMPFDSLKGLQEALRAREERRSRIEKRTLSEDMKDKLSKIFQRLQKQSRVQVTFYLHGHYLDLEGDIAEIDKFYGFIKIENQKIFFDDIFSLQIIES